MEAIGFRYVDLVKPRTANPWTTTYQWVLPPKPDIEDEEMDLLQGMYIAAYRTRWRVEISVVSKTSGNIADGSEQPRHSEKRLGASYARR